MLKQTHFRALFFFLILLLLTALFPLSVSASGETSTDYDSYYAEGAKISWDAFDRHTGDTHTEEDKALFKKNATSSAGTFGEGYLSVKGTVLDFSALFANDGKTDYTLDLTVAMQKSSSGTIDLGALRNFSVMMGHGVSETDQHPVDESYGLVSSTFRALTKPDGTRFQFATDVGWKPIHFLGKPLGQVYSVGISTDYEIASEGTGTAHVTLFRDALAVQDGTLAYPITAWKGNALNSSVFRIENTVNFDFYALRYYERALTPIELQLNHFVDLAKWFGISLDVYDTYSQEIREDLHLALHEETFDTLTKSLLQSTVDGFGTHRTALKITDYITFEGFSVALWGDPALRSVYSVDLSAVASLEKAGYDVTVGALLAVEGERDIADITKSTAEQAVSCDVYKNGEFVNSVIKSDEDSFRFALVAHYDTESSQAYYGESIFFRAFLTVEKDGKSTTYYLDAEGDTFGNSVSIEEISLLLAFLGHTAETPIQTVLGDHLIALAEANRKSYTAIYETRKDSAAHTADVADYLFLSYAARAAILTNTGVSGNVYSYANASPYYKLFTENHEERNESAHDTVSLLLQCENVSATVNFAAEMTNKLYNKLLTEQAVYKTLSSLLTTVEKSAIAQGLDAEKTASLIERLASFVAAHEKAIADNVRDLSVIKGKMQAVKESLVAPAKALAALRAKLFEKNDLPAFGTETRLSSYVIVTDTQNEASALMLSSALSDQYGVFVPYYTSFPKTAEYAHTISLFDASNTDAKDRLNDNDYLLTKQSQNVQLFGKTPADVQLATVVFTRSLTHDSVTLTESCGRDIPELFDTDLPTYLPKLNVKAVEDGGVLDRFYQVLSQMPDEYAVIEPLSPEDYPLSASNAVYVSPNGHDDANGTYDAPFKTLDRALDHALGKGGVQIFLFAGTYRINRPLSITAMHSGSKLSPLCISAMPGEEVIFTTAETMKGEDFHPVTDESVIARLDTFTDGNHKNVYVADLAALGITEYGKTSTSGEPFFLIDGKQHTLARYPNENEALIPLLTPDCILKQSQVTTAASYLYAEHNQKLETEAGWKLRIDESSAYRDRLEKWTWTDSADIAESIWLHGVLYEEYHKAHYPILIRNEAEGITLSSAVNCPWGIYTRSTGLDSRNGYFYNILEELDADGEWYLDHKTGKLYVYASEGISADANAAMISSTNTVLTLKNASNVILNGITFAETLGHGLHVTDCETVLVQNCTFRDTRNSGALIENSYNSGVISSEFYRISTTMLVLQGRNDRSTMTPDRLFMQNCYFHTPKLQAGAKISGISCLASHNRFDDTTISIGGAECVIEYNVFHRGSQHTYDNGPIGCGGASGPKGNHIRYNYLYGINHSLYGIYIDDLSSDNYAYSNIFIYDSSVSSGSRCINIHGGHQNVACYNVLVNAREAGIRDNVNYYLRNVYDTNGVAIPTPSIRYYTKENGTQAIDTKNLTGGSLGYRWDSLMISALSAYDKAGGSNARYAERFPHLALYMELMRVHLDASHADKNYKWESATVAWNFTPKQGTKYAWGNESLYEFLLSCKDTQDIEVYLRSPAYNEYFGNVFLGCSTDVYSYTPWGVRTTNVRNNYGLPASSEYFKQAMRGDIREITQASTWQAIIPDFQTIPYQKLGRTELGGRDIFPFSVPFDENADVALPFDELFDKQ